MKRNFMTLIFCLALPFAVGLLSNALTGDAMSMFAARKQPPLSPPAIVFPVVWTILYALMGISSYLVLMSGSGKEDIQKAIRLYVWQLTVNFLWPTFFFSFGWYLFQSVATFMLSLACELFEQWDLYCAEASVRVRHPHMLKLMTKAGFKQTELLMRYPGFDVNP